MSHSCPNPSCFAKLKGTSRSWTHHFQNSPRCISYLEQTKSTARLSNVAVSSAKKDSVPDEITPPSPPPVPETVTLPTRIQTGNTRSMRQRSNHSSFTEDPSTHFHFDSHPGDDLSYDSSEDEPDFPLNPDPDTPPTPTIPPSPTTNNSGPTRVTLIGGGSVVLGVTQPIAQNQSFRCSSVEVPPWMHGMAKLLDVSRNMNVSSAALTRIMQTIQQEIDHQNFNILKLPMPRTALKHILQRFPSVKPNTASIPLEQTKKQKDNKEEIQTVNFPIFNFIDQVQDILDDDVFADLDNVAVDPTH